MRLPDLIQRLQEIHEQEGDLEVRAAIQPNYPLAVKLDGVISDSSFQHKELTEEEEGSLKYGGSTPESDPEEFEGGMTREEELQRRTRPIVWLVTGSAADPDRPYADKALWLHI